MHACGLEGGWGAPCTNGQQQVMQHIISTRPSPNPHDWMSVVCSPKWWMDVFILNLVRKGPFFYSSWYIHRVGGLMLYRERRRGDRGEMSEEEGMRDEMR